MKATQPDEAAAPFPSRAPITLTRVLKSCFPMRYQS